MYSSIVIRVDTDEKLQHEADDVVFGTAYRIKAEHVEEVKEYVPSLWYLDIVVWMVI